MIERTEQVGITVAVCTHNGANRLATVLHHLWEQQIPPRLPWEILVIDNASTDDTPRLLDSLPRGREDVQMRSVRESNLGLNLARQRAFLEARYDVVSFVDDDNFVDRSWVRTVADILSVHPEVGACGGQSEAVFETQPPWWFRAQQYAYAVGDQGPVVGDVTDTRGYLWGAGLTVRKAAWRALREGGFRMLLTDRRGSALKSGGDSELCFALALAGWRLWYDPQLRLRHFLPTGRLSWNYLRRLHRSFGAASVILDLYSAVKNMPADGFVEEMRLSWPWQVLSTYKRLIRQRSDVAHAFRASERAEGDDRALAVEREVGRLFELLSQRGRYQRDLAYLSNAAWWNLRK